MALTASKTASWTIAPQRVWWLGLEAGDPPDAVTVACMTAFQSVTTSARAAPAPSVPAASSAAAASLKVFPFLVIPPVVGAAGTPAAGGFAVRGHPPPCEPGDGAVRPGRGAAGRNAGVARPVGGRGVTAGARHPVEATAATGTRQPTVTFFRIRRRPSRRRARP